MLYGIKKICALSSKQIAARYARIKRKSFFDTEDEKNQEVFVQLKNRAEKLSKRHRINMCYEPTTSRVRKANGEWIDIMGFVQYFSKEAPLLSEFLNELGGMFEVDSEVGTIRFFGIQMRGPSDFCSAEYFVSSEEIYALNLANEEIFQFKGRQTSAVTQGPDGKAVISLNLEHEPSLWDLIYEVIRAKWPEQLSQQRLSHESIDQISVQAEKQLNLSGNPPIVEVDALKGERLQISDRFKAFDLALTSCLRSLGIS